LKQEGRGGVGEKGKKHHQNEGDKGGGGHQGVLGVLGESQLRGTHGGGDVTEKQFRTPKMGALQITTRALSRWRVRVAEGRDPGSPDSMFFNVGNLFEATATERGVPARLDIMGGNKLG